MTEWQDAGGWIPCEHKCVECGRNLFLDAERGICEECAKQLAEKGIRQEEWPTHRMRRALERLSALPAPEKPEEALALCLRHLGLYFGVERAAADLYNPQRDLLEAKAGIGVDPAYLKTLTFPRDGRPMREYPAADDSPVHEACVIRCFRQEKIVVVNDRRGDPAYDEYAAEKKRYEEALAEGCGPEVLRFLKPARAYARSFALFPCRCGRTGRRGVVCVYRLDNEFWSPFRPEEISSMEGFISGAVARFAPMLDRLSGEE